MCKKNGDYYNELIQRIKSKKLQKHEYRLVLDVNQNSIVVAQNFERTTGYPVDLKGASIHHPIFFEIVFGDTNKDYETYHKTLFDRIIARREQTLDRYYFMSYFPIRHGNGEITTLAQEILKPDDECNIWIMSGYNIFEEGLSINRRFVFKLNSINNDSGLSEMNNPVYRDLKKAIRKENPDYFHLTPSEFEYIPFLDKGYQTQEIAKAVEKPWRTVETHIRNVMKKARQMDNSINNRTGLLNFLREGGELDFLYPN